MFKITVPSEFQGSEMKITVGGKGAESHHVFQSSRKMDTPVVFGDEDVNEDINISLPYAASVVWSSVAGKVFAGGDNGLLSIDVATLNIDEVSISTLSRPTIRQILLYDEVLYVLTETDIYSSTDYGSTWQIIEKYGLPDEIYQLQFVDNNFVVLFV